MNIADGWEKLTPPFSDKNSKTIVCDTWSLMSIKPFLYTNTYVLFIEFVFQAYILAIV